jgi:hypothetical protein
MNLGTRMALAVFVRTEIIFALWGKIMPNSEPPQFEGRKLSRLKELSFGWTEIYRLEFSQQQEY